MMDAAGLKHKFLKRLVSQPALELLEYLPDTYFFAKDRQGRFMAVNTYFLKASGMENENMLIGKTDAEIWPWHLAEVYRRDDIWVMENGKPIINKLELSRNATGGSDWFCTTKVPLYDKKGLIHGIAGFARDVKKAHSSFKPYMEMSKVIEYILSNYASPINLKSLAEMAAMSTSQFERRFKKHFSCTPTSYISSIRIQAACQLLAEGSLSVNQIAFKTGHYDHSHLNRFFSKAMGQSATQYRSAHAKPVVKE
jgi:PAS domain S-box-containing protein